MSVALTNFTYISACDNTVLEAHRRFLEIWKWYYASWISSYPVIARIWYL